MGYPIMVSANSKETVRGLMAYMTRDMAEDREYPPEEIVEQWEEFKLLASELEMDLRDVFRDIDLPRELLERFGQIVGQELHDQPHA